MKLTNRTRATTHPSIYRSVGLRCRTMCNLAERQVCRNLAHERIPDQMKLDGVGKMLVSAWSLAGI
jgi:hypothetical protein